jgi:hypothetical protein
MKSIFTSVVCLLTVFITAAHGQSVQKQIPITPNGRTVIAAGFHDMKVRIQLITHQVNIGKPSDKKPGTVRSNCTYSRYPCSIVDAIDITVNGASVIVPRSVFSDLADLNYGQVGIMQKSSILTMAGGDASESYVVRIRFNRERITGRSLFDGESGEKLQETTYYRVGE